VLLATALAGFVLAGCTQEASPPLDAGLIAASSRSVPLGVFHGSAATEDVATFGARLGRPVDLAHDYLDKRRWSSITEVSHLTDRWRAAGFAGRTVFTVPMIPDTGGTLASGARGRYNAYFRTLARRLVAGGHDMAILRLGPEFNGTWFKWTINVRDGGRLFASYWRQIVVTMRSVKGARFRFDWAPNAGSSYVASGRQLSAASAYPGDRYVDYIGMDVFDQSWEAGPKSDVRRWRHLVGQRDGLNWHARFANAHRKPMTFPEWGLVKRRNDNRGGGDAPYFITQMYNWMKKHPVAYHLYFESRDPSGDYRVFGGKFPKAAKRFISLFGVPPTQRAKPPARAPVTPA
jgi:hypothetical protein